MVELYANKVYPSCQMIRSPETPNSKSFGISDPGQARLGPDLCFYAYFFYLLVSSFGQDFFNIPGNYS